VICQSEAAAGLRERFESELTGHGPQPATLRLVEGPSPAEGYELTFLDDELVVAAAGPAGFRHALETLRQLAPAGPWPRGRVSDWPQLGLRGFHLNFESYRRMGIPEAEGLLRAAARFKLNTVLVEYGPRFPFEDDLDCRSPDALSAADLGRLRGLAGELGLALIPLQQSIAHLDYLLAGGRHAGIRERQDRAGLLCPAHPDSMPLIRRLVDAVLALHPGSRYFHLGGDEARKIGGCPRCSGRPGGPAGLYGRHMGELARWLLERGVRPIVWDDTLCAFPGAIDLLPKEVIIDYWDYIAVADPTPVLIPRMAHVGGAPRVAHDWRWHLSRQRGRLSDVQRGVMKSYSRGVRLPGALGRAYLDEFGRYLGESFPRWVRALPYLEYYQDRGHQVICSPTGMGNGDTLDGAPNFARFEANIATHARRCRENSRALGILTTAWYDMPVETLFQPLIRTAMSAWQAA
jgi:hypothetical protein